MTTFEEAVRRIMKRKETRILDWPMSMSTAEDALCVDRPVPYALSELGEQALGAASLLLERYPDLEKP